MKTPDNKVGGSVDFSPRDDLQETMAILEELIIYWTNIASQQPDFRVHVGLQSQELRQLVGARNRAIGQHELAIKQIKIQTSSIITALSIAEIEEGLNRKSTLGVQSYLKQLKSFGDYFR